MTTNWNKPDLDTDTKASWMGETRALGASCIKQLVTGDSNIPTGAIEFDQSTYAWKMWNGSSFDRLFPAAGIVQHTVLSTAPNGYIFMHGGTIGDASSGASVLAHAKAADLFAALWNSLTNTEAPVSSGRGASAAADFAAHKTITLPDARQKFIITKAASGTGSTLGGTGGTIDHTHTGPSHTHTMANHTHGSTNLRARVGFDLGDAGTGIGFALDGVNLFTEGHHWTASGVTISTGSRSVPSTTLFGNTDGPSTNTSDASGTGATGSANPPFLALNTIIKL